MYIHIYIYIYIYTHIFIARLRIVRAPVLQALALQLELLDQRARAKPYV